MKKNILIIALSFMPAWLLAQNVKTPTSSNRISDEDFYDEYEYGGEEGFAPTTFILDDSDGVYVLPSDNTPSTQPTTSQPTTSQPTYSPSATAPQSAPQAAANSNQIEDSDDLLVGEKKEMVPTRVTETVEVKSGPAQIQRVGPQLIHHEPDTTSQDTTPKRVFNGDGHHLQLGFGGGWTGMYTRISEDLGVSKMTAPAFTGSVSYFFYPTKWVGLGTGLQLSKYSGNILMNSDAVKIYDKYTDASGVYRFPEDADGDRYRHRIGMGGFNEVEDIHLLEIPIAMQLKYKIGGIAGFYTTLGVKMGIPISSKYKVKAGEIEHYGYYGLYNMTLHNIPGYFGTVDYTNTSGSYSAGKQLMAVNFLGYAEVGFAIRLTQRLDLLVGAYFDMAFHDVTMAKRDADKTPIGFNTAKYNYPWMNEYKGMIGTDMLGEIRPYNVGIKVGLDFNVAPKKQKKDKDDDEEEKEDNKLPINVTDTIRDTLVIIHDTIIYHRITDHYEYDTLGYDPEKHARIREYMDPNSDNPYLNGSQTRSPQNNSYNPADGDDYVFNEAALDKGRKYSEDLHNRSEALSGDEQELIDYLSNLSIRFQLDKAYPPFVVPRQGLNVVAETLKQNPDIVIAVNGHACRLGTEKYNRRLALRRARNIAKLLKMKGVDESQMLVASYGSHVPSAYGAHSLSKDRRVELVMLGSMTYEQREAYLNKFAEQIQIQEMINDGQRDNAYDLYDTYEKEIVVKRGASLARIAASYYGDPDYWVYIYEANADIISNPRVIEPNTSLMVPSRENITKGRSAAEVKREALQLREYYLRQIGYSGEDL